MIQSLNSYKAFYEVAKAENLSKAAKVLLISQPAISKTINSLEKELGVKLFDRSIKGVNLTTEGKILYDHVAVALNSIDDAEKKLSTFSSINFGHLRIAATQTMCTHILIPYITKYTNEYLNMRLTVNTMPNIKSFEKIENKTIDLALVIKKDPIPKTIAYVPLKELSYCFVASKEYLEYYDKIFPNDKNYFNNANIMLLDKLHETRSAVDEYFSKEDIYPSQILEGSSMDLLIAFAKAHMGIASVIEKFVEKELSSGELVKIHIHGKLEKRSVGFIYNKTNKSKAVEDFLKIIQSYKKSEC